MRREVVWGLGVALVIGAAACGGGSDPTSPSSPTPPSGSGTQATTVTISSTGVSPKSITVTAGTQVLFVNSDVQKHEMYSNPHPEHTDCPEINQVGFLNPGDRRQTGNLNTRRVCGYHDHGDPTNTSLQGTILIQ